MPRSVIIGDRPNMAPATSDAGHEARSLLASRNTPTAASAACAMCITVIETMCPETSTATHRGG
ncbi:hypothetical protein VZQ01_32735 [Myxococcus faecalis]|uniref:hypothetical protein n=1 Tax=Myxococcus faecalis TaxID=3115646 RepID=UPI003CF47871